MLGTSIESKDTLEIIGGSDVCENRRISERNEYLDYDWDWLLALTALVFYDSVITLCRRMWGSV